MLLKQTFQGSVRTEFNYVGVSRHLDRHQMDFFVTVLVRLCRHLIDRRIPARVRLAHSAPSGCRKSSDSVATIEFNAPVDDVSFDKTVKDMRIASEDPYLNRFLTDYCEQALSNRITPRSALRTDIENEIVKLLPHGQAAFGVVALRLGVSRRTLARRLTSERLTFSGVLQDLRADLAKRYLKDRSLSISQIAWLLGYREVGSFTHAFRRWTNDTPKQSRSRRVA